MYFGMQRKWSTNESGQDVQSIDKSRQLYRLGPHDVVALTVFGEPDLTKEMEVDGQGKD